LERTTSRANLGQGTDVPNDDETTAGSRHHPDLGWLIKRAPQTDLWFHALAVVQADQPGPLGLYSADYARRIREAKQQLGVYPTVLDSLAPDFRTAFDRDSSLTTMHFVPLYFPRATAERMLGALRAVAKRKTEDSSAVGRDVRLGVAVLSRAFQKGSQRRLLESLVNAMSSCHTSSRFSSAGV
jgi:hypothetical protein